MRIYLIVLAIISGVPLAVEAARAAIELTPGAWQDTETGEENGKPVPPQITVDCMTAVKNDCGLNKPESQVTLGRLRSPETS